MSDEYEQVYGYGILEGSGGEPLGILWARVGDAEGVPFIAFLSVRIEPVFLRLEDIPSPCADGDTLTINTEIGLLTLRPITPDDANVILAARPGPMPVDVITFMMEAVAEIGSECEPPFNYDSKSVRDSLVLDRTGRLTYDVTTVDERLIAATRISGKWKTFYELIDDARDGTVIHPGFSQTAVEFADAGLLPTSQLLYFLSCDPDTQVHMETLDGDGDPAADSRTYIPLRLRVWMLIEAIRNSPIPNVWPHLGSDETARRLEALRGDEFIIGGRVPILEWVLWRSGERVGEPDQRTLCGWSDGDVHQRLLAASSYSSPPEILRRLAEDADLEVVKSVAGNPECPVDLLWDLYRNRPDLHSALAGNDGAPADLLRELANHYVAGAYVAARDGVVESLIGHPATPGDVVLTICENGPRRYALMAMSSLVASPTVVEALIEEYPNESWGRVHAIREDVRDFLDEYCEQFSDLEEEDEEIDLGDDDLDDELEDEIDGAGEDDSSEWLPAGTPTSDWRTWTDLTSWLESQKLPNVRIPDNLATKPLRVNKIFPVWSTTNDIWGGTIYGPFNLGPEFTETVIETANHDDFLMAGVAGRGSSSWGLGVVAQFHSWIVVVQTGYGGVYSDGSQKPDSAVDLIAEWNHFVEQAERQIDTEGGSLTSGPRYLVIYSDYRDYADLFVRVDDVQETAQRPGLGFKNWKLVRCVVPNRPPIHEPVDQTDEFLLVENFLGSLVFGSLRRSVV